MHTLARSSNSSRFSLAKALPPALSSLSKKIVLAEVAVRTKSMQNVRVLGWRKTGIEESQCEVLKLGSPNGVVNMRFRVE